MAKPNNTRNEAATPALENVSKSIEVVSNNKLEIVDNTDAVEAAPVAVEAEERELLGGLIQVDYR